MLKSNFTIDTIDKRILRSNIHLVLINIIDIKVINILG
jgi:hypothetical protein